MAQIRTRFAFAASLAFASAVVALGACTGAGASTGAAPADRRQGTITVYHLTVDGETRTYRVYDPSAAPRMGAPVVLALHGLYGSGAQFERSSGWDQTAARAGVIVAYPDSYTQGWRFSPGEVADVDFLTRVIADITRRYHADRRRVYVSGHSSGAFMSYRMACDRAAMIAAIGPDAGAPASDCSAPPARPLSVISIAGTADTVVPYGGGVPHVPGRPTTVSLPSAHQVIARWVRWDGCNPQQQMHTSGSVTTEIWTGCRAHTETRLLSLAGWPHTYPTSADGAPIDGSSTIWAFLRTYRLPA